MANDYNLFCWKGPGTSVTSRYVSTLRQTTTAGTDFWITCQKGKVQTIVLDGLEYQATMYWGPSGKLVLEHCVNRGSWARVIYDGKRGMPDIGPPSPADDAHETITFEFDSLGHIHAFYDHHNEALNYRMTTLPIDDPSFVGLLGSETAITGLTSVTYANPFRDPLDNLYLSIGQGVGTAERDQYLLKLSTPGVATWAAAPGTSTNGLLCDGQSDVQGIYIFYPDFTPDWDGAGTGYMYLAGTWKLDEGTTTLYNPFFLRYDGTTFSKTTGAQTVPLRFNNCEILDAAGVSNGFSSGASVCSDSQGRPHVTFLKGATNRGIEHYYHNGTSWVGVTVATGSGAAAYIMPGTMVAWPDDTISIMLRRESDDHIVSYNSLPNDYTDWSDVDDLSGEAVGAEFTVGDGVAVCIDSYGFRNKGRVEFPLPLAVAKPFLLEFLQGHYDSQDIEESRGHSNAKRLTNNNTVTFAAGKIGNAANFEVDGGTSQNLSVAANQIVPATGSQTYMFWFNLESLGATRGLIGSWLATGNQRSVAMNVNTTPRVEAFISKDGSTSTQVIGSTLGAPTTATWYAVILVIDAVADLISLYLGTGTTLGAADTAAHTADGVSGDHVFNGSEAFRLGRGTSNVAANFMDGLIDELAVLWGVPNATQIAAWFGDGDGLPIDRFGMLPPELQGVGASETLSIAEGETAVVTLPFYGDVYKVAVSKTGADAADFTWVDNGNGTATLAFAAPATVGSYAVTPRVTNPAGYDEVALTINVTGEGASTALSSKPSIALGLGIGL